MGPAVTPLLEWMDHVFREDGWHVGLLDSVEDLTAAQAAWAPSPQRNSIWKIVNHVALWKEDVARRIAGDPPRSEGWHKSLDWKEIPHATEEAWRGAVRRLLDTHAAVKAELAKRSDDDLTRPAPGSSQPLYASIRGAIAHDSYHCGQICYIRALQGVPVKGF